MNEISILSTILGQNSCFFFFFSVFCWNFHCLLTKLVFFCAILSWNLNFFFNVLWRNSPFLYDCMSKLVFFPQLYLGCLTRWYHSKGVFRRNLHYFPQFFDEFFFFFFPATLWSSSCFFHNLLIKLKIFFPWMIDVFDFL